MSSPAQTASQLRSLHLASMATAYELQLQQPTLNQMSFDDRLASLVETEVSTRENRRLKTLLKKAQFPMAASLEDFDLRPGRAVDKSLLSTLANCEWIRRQQNLILLGATGVGKTYLACALGNQACRQRISVGFRRMSDLVDEIATAAVDGSLRQLKKTLAVPSLLIIDDLGQKAIDATAANVLLDVLDLRERTGSLLITSQYPVGEWHSFFPDETVADAVLDRVVHQSHHMPMKGESMRKVRAQQKLKED